MNSKNVMRSRFTIKTKIWNETRIQWKGNETWDCSKKIRFRLRTHTGYNETKTRFSSSSSSVHGISYQGTETDQSYLIPMTMVMNKTGW